MKERYIRQVEKALHVPRRQKAEIVRDLDEIFASAMEHGETEQQVIGRLGTPREFADHAAAQFGVDAAALRMQKRFVSIGIALAAARFGKASSDVSPTAILFCIGLPNLRRGRCPHRPGRMHV